MEAAMEILTPIVVGVVLALLTSIQSWINKGRFDALEHRMDTHERSNERRFEQLMTEVAQLRSDLLQVALAATPRPQTG
jgi:hypothetical protein